MRTRAWVLFAVALLLIGLLVWAIPHIGDWLTKPQVTVPGVVGKVDTIPDTTAMQQRPETTTTRLQRIVKRTVKGHVSLSQGTPDTALARKFADAVSEAARWRDSVAKLNAKGDTTTPRPPKPKVILPTTWGHVRDGRLQLGLTRSDGSVLNETVKAAGHIEWYTGYDRGSDTLPVIRADRWFVRAARQTVKCAPRAALLGGGAGAATDTEKPLRGAIRGAVFTLAGCLIG